MTRSTHALENHLFRQYWDDGLLDLLSGIGLLLIGGAWTLDLVPLAAAVPAILLPFWVVLRRRIVEPRAGVVEFSAAREHRTTRLLSGSAWLGAGVLLAMVAMYLILPSDPGPLLPVLTPALPAVLLALPAALVGLGLGLPRFLAYATLLVACGAVVVMASLPPATAMFVTGLVVVANGARLLHAFLRLTPEPAA